MCVYESILVGVHAALLSFVLTPQVTIQTLKHEDSWPFEHFFSFCNGKTVITGNKITQTFPKVLILQLPLVTSSDSELFRLTISYTKKKINKKGKQNKTALQHLLLLV